MKILEEMSSLLQKGRKEKVRVLVTQALDDGLDPKDILNKGLLSGMMAVGEKFKNNEIFVTEVLMAGHALNAGLSVLEPRLSEVGSAPVGKVVIGTVKGDSHDIGKNLVALMMKGVGFEVIDIGVDADADRFISEAECAGADVICMSALLTTSMPYMKVVIDALKEQGLRDKYIIMVGGTSVDEDFAREIGADYYTPDAVTAAKTARQAVLEKLR